LLYQEAGANKRKKMTKLVSSTTAIGKATIEPVCGMHVVPGKVTLVAVYDGFLLKGGD